MASNNLSLSALEDLFIHCSVDCQCVLVCCCTSVPWQCSESCHSLVLLSCQSLKGARLYRRALVRGTDKCWGSGGAKLK